MIFESALVSAEQLAGKLGSSGLVLLDCRFNLLDPEAGRKAYLEGHIPGASYADLDQDLAGPIGPASGRHPMPAAGDFQRRLGAWGIARHTAVVAYDDVGGAIAARAWWLLQWLGHPEAALLDGGLPAWIAGNHPLETDTPEPKVEHYIGPPGQRRVYDTAALEAGLRDGTIVLLDARDEPRFLGQQEPIDTAAGHVPGAINAPFQRNLSADGRFRPSADLAELYAPMIGDRSADAIVCMCGSGITACHNIFAIEQAGYGSSSLYAGSWSEWIRSGDRPIATA
jgi:thiosulfate/3-mercaptopyruvate sulfurtransferase